MPLKLGRKMGRSLPEDVLRLTDYLVDPLPVWDGSDNFTSGITDWGMLGNGPDPLVTNQGPGFGGVGDCGPVGDYHYNLANAATAKETQPSIGGQVPNEIVAEYLAYDGGQDNGVDLAGWLTYRLTHTLAGLPVIGGFAQVSDSGAEFQSALHVFAGIYAGILISQEAYDQYPDAWTSTATDWIGGHCVPILARNADNGVCVTWGTQQRFSWPWWRVAREEAFVIFTPEQMNAPGGVFQGVKVAQLKADLAKLGGTT
jgi:hypothetical protein